MKRLSLFLFTLLVYLVGSSNVSAQNAILTVEILDANSRPITQIVDGNRIQLRATLTEIVNSDTQVDFLFDNKLVTACHVLAKEKTCTTDPIETLGWYWAEGGVARSSRKIQAKTGNEAGEIVLNISPRPVVLVHGLISTSKKFDDYLIYLESIGINGYVVGDGQFNGTLNMGDLGNPSEPTLTIAENAAQLDMYIDGVIESTGTEQVDLIAHSMGGLVARYYIHQLMTEDDVAQLIMLGTPNGGSPCGGMLSSLGFFMPATLELQTSYINEIFNQQITNTRSVPFYAVAGSFINDPTFSPCSGVPSDSSVSQASVEAIPLHLSGIPPLEHNFLATDESAFREFVQPLLQSTTTGFASPAALKPASVPLPGQFTRTYSGHLEKDGSTSITIEIDENVGIASFGLYDSTQSLQISVQGASGKTLELDLENKGIVITDPETMLYLGYGFENPKPGAWVVTLSTSERTPSSGTDYALYARFAGGAILHAQSNQLLPKLGRVVELSASLEGGQIESARANILLPNGERKEIMLSPSDDGFFAEFTPTQAGLHEIEIIATGTSTARFRIDRAATIVLEAQPVPSSPVRIWIIYLGLLAGVFLLFALPITVIIKYRRK